MRKNAEPQGGYQLDLVFFPYDQMDKFNEFSKQYKNVPDKYILREIMRVKNEVSKDVLQKHIKNLDELSKMEGFVTSQNKHRIDAVKRILSAESATPATVSQSVSKEFWGGSSLLLWFLTLAAIWRRPFWGIR